MGWGIEIGLFLISQTSRAPRLTLNAISSARYGAAGVMARVELQAHRDKSAPAAQIEADVDALAGVQEHALELAGRREKAAVRAEQVEGNQGFTVAESKQQAARVARIQELE